MRLVMKLRPLLSWLALSAALLASFQVAETALPAWSQVADGIEYSLFELPGPNRVHVARMDRQNPNLIVDSSIAQGKLARGLETVRDMAERYNGAINAWGGSWGQRNRVVVAINGSFHNQGTGVPESGQIQSGWYVKRFDDLGGGSGFAWGMDREAFIGGCVAHSPKGQRLRYHRTGHTQEIDGINVGRGRNQLIVYTPHYDASTGTSSAGVEVLVELTQPISVLPRPLMLRGYVTSIRDGHGSTPIPFDHVVLSATGGKRTKLLENLGIGDEIGISMEINHLKNDCVTPNPLSWTRTYASLAGSFHFLHQRRIQSFPNDRGATNRNPRTAICYNAAFLYFVVVDGRDAERSIGMTIDELAAFCRNRLGATSGINQDGGGSSTMWINGGVVNEPWKGVERRVANGMMMIAVEPMEISNSLSDWTSVATAVPTEIRLGPGSNYASLASIPPGVEGLILPHRSRLNGVRAKGGHWWKVVLEDKVGWVLESALISLELPTISEPVSRPSTHPSLESQ